MARGINPTRLTGIIQQLQQERREHQRRIDQIGAIFTKCGIAPPAAGAAKTAGKRGRPRRGRKRFDKSGPQSILDFIQANGQGGASSAELSQHWKSEGRTGEPYITLGHLVKQKKLKRKSLKGQRGSQYKLI